MKSKFALLVFILVLFIPFTSASLIDDLKEIEPKVREFTNEDQANSLIVEGKYATTAEKLIFAYLKEKHPNVAGIKYVHEDEADPADFVGKNVILIGGPTQNKFADQFNKDQSYTKEVDELRAGSAAFLESESGKILIFSDYEGYNNLPKRLDKSPLAGFVPLEFIPAAATLIGFSLLWFWVLLKKFIVSMFKTITSTKIMSWVRKKELKGEFLGFHIKGVRFKIREWTAILIAAAVFAVSLSYIYLAPGADVFKFLVATILVNLAVYGLRNLVRLFMDRRHALHTEYMLWIWGAIVTAFTGWMGNAFSLAGYVVSEDDKHTKYEGRINFFVNFITFIAFIILWFMNFFNPSVLFQMAMLLCLSITYLQLLPMKPFSGPSIYKWKAWVWWIFFIPMTFIYIMINLII